MRVRVAFTLYHCEREAMSFVTTTGGITGKGVRDLRVTAIEHRFVRTNRLLGAIGRLTDNSNCFVACETRRFAARLV